MSSYIKLIIFIIVLLLISAAVLFIDSSMDNINESMPKISEGIVQGDIDYNESVELVNDKYYEKSMEKATSAGDNYNDSLNKLVSIRDKFNNDLKDVHRDYMDTTIKELQLKLQAVDKLKLSIENYESHYNYTGSNYATEANELIYDSLQYQNERNQIVNDNRELFN